MADSLANRTYDLRALYERAFGHVALPYPAGGLNNLGNPIGTVVNTVKGAFRFRSVLGAEYLFPVKINGYQLPNEPLVSIFGSNNIIETPLNRGDRVENVLEEINLNNYKVRIRGVVYSEDPEEYPEEEVLQIRKILEAPGSKTIECELLRIFNITQVAVKSISFPGIAGTPEAQAYDMQCLSDRDFELEVINESEEIQ